ncbi:hypothetical protein C5O00_03855 [Pukyongia salina]|uniref:Uncharacterized protein n=1 Tax=Pukyongia salina TaxID=2094025 RepID=A0A2S0HUW7_9FLAO|nr:hypothetical protein [Pukyongia salina]AVI50344.1 hypothetical protein C5O00_03855 [Pukyongia salina]
MGLHKILKIVALLLAVAGIVSLVMVLLNGGGLDAQLYIAYITLALTLFIVLVYVLKETFSGNLKKTLMSVGAFLLVVIIAYVMAEGVETEMRDGEILSASGSKWVGTGLNTFYILAVVAIGSMIYSGIKKATTR